MCQSSERVHNKKMEKASREPWIEFEHNPRAMQLREYTVKEFGEVFVNERPFWSGLKQQTS